MQPLLFLLLFLATFVEGTLKYIYEGAPEPWHSRMKPFIPYCAMVLGISISCYYHLDILKFFGLTLDGGLVSYLITGVIIGRGSNYLNDLVSKLRTGKGEPLPILEGNGVDNSEGSV